MILEDKSAQIKLLHYKVSEYRTEQAWKRFSNAGFKPVLIKGWAAAQNYDEPSERIYNDVDLAFAPEEYDAAVEFLEKAQTNDAVDLHEGLRTLDTLDYAQLYAVSRTVKCGEGEVRVLCPEDHLRVLCVHWLLDGGAKREKLWDIFYAVKNRPTDFDWERCLNVVSQTRRRWIIYTINLARMYLKLDVSGTPLAETPVEVPKWLVKTLEKEWKSEVILIPLHFVLDDPGKFWKQVEKRFPPNPLQAMVQMEGDFDKSFLIPFYQVGNIWQRFSPLVKRVLNKIKVKR